MYRLYNGALECQLRTYTISETGAVRTGDESSSGDGEYTISSATLKVAEEFANRLKKNLKKLEKWAAREGRH